MSLTPFEAASAWLWVPTVLSFGAMTRTFAPCAMSACACASSVASLPCALSILNSDELYPAIWKAFVKYGRSELTHRVDDVVSGMRTPPTPLPAPCRSSRGAMAEKLTSNEEMLRLAGTTAGDAVAVPPPPPQAIATIPTTPIAGISLANLIGSLSYLSHLLPSSRMAPGRECAGEQALLRNPRRDRPPVQSMSYTYMFVKSAMVRVTQFVQTLDKPRLAAMIPMGGGGKERRGDARMAARPQPRARVGRAPRARAHQPGRHRPDDGAVAHDRAHAGL